MNLVVLLFGCGDPALEPFDRSLDAYDEGRAALEAGTPEKAAEAFVAARAGDATSTVLALWEAKALADAGRLADADARLGEIIRAHPDDGLALYNRASYRVRAGRPTEAAADLREALRLGVRSPFEAVADPDFSAMAGTPEFEGVLPADTIAASLEGPGGSVFVGSRFDLTFRIVGLPGVALDLSRGGADPGCLTLLRLVEDRHSEAGMLARSVTATFRADGPCDATLGPFELLGGAAPISLAAVAVKVDAPVGTPLAAGHVALPSRLPLPGSYAPPDAGARAERTPAGVVAIGRADRSLTGNGRRADVALELRVDGQTRATGGWWVDAGPVTVAAKGFEQTVP